MKLASIELAFGLVFGASIALSTIHPWGNPRPQTQPGAPLLDGSEVPAAVLETLAKKCGDCHSDRTRYPLYSHFAPVSWMIERDVATARSRLDLSRWRSYTDDDRTNVLTRIASEVRSGQMPPARYVLLHSQARLSSEEQELVYDWAKSERKRLRAKLSPPSNSTPIESRTANP